MNLFTVFSIPVIRISGANDLFSKNLFVTNEEKEKLEKLNLIEIQWEYYK